MRVLMLTVDFPPNPSGGEGLVAARFATALRDRGVQLEVVAPCAPGSERFDIDLHIPVHRVPIWRNNFITRTISFALQTRHIVKNYRGDLVYALRPVFASDHCPMVSHFHTTRTGEARGAMTARHWFIALCNAAFIPVDRIHTRHSSTVIAPDKRMRHDLGFNGVSEDRFRVVPNGVDLNRFGSIVPRVLNTSRILYVGRLDPRKGILDLISTFRALSKQRSDLHLTIIGRGPLEQRLRDIINTESLQTGIDLLPAVSHEQMPEIYRSHDLLIVPSLYEPFGLVILEAMAAGLPVISSDQCVELGQPTYPAGDIKTLERLILHYLSNPALAEKLVPANQAMAAAYSWDAAVDLLINTFQATLARTSSRRP